MNKLDRLLAPIRNGLFDKDRNKTLRQLCDNVIVSDVIVEQPDRTIAEIARHIESARALNRRLDQIDAQAKFARRIKNK